MTIRATQFVPFEAKLVVGEGASRTTQALPMKRGQSITGRVFDSADGNGIRGALVVFRDPNRAGSHWRTPQTTHTMRDGWFMIEGVPRGDLSIEIQASGYSLKQLRSQPHSGEPLAIALAPT